MAYERKVDLWYLAGLAHEYAQVQWECRASGIDEVMADLSEDLKKGIDRLQNLPLDKEFLGREPDDLDAIKALRPDGVRRMQKGLPDNYEERLSGALHGRIAGCLLGALVEGYPIEDMKKWAKAFGDNFPPTDYWSKAPGLPGALHYWMSPVEDFTRGQMNHAPVDDDIMYTLVGLLAMEEYGKDFTTDDMGKIWLKYVPYGYTAEDAALKNLQAGIPGSKAAIRNNPYGQLIGADIRSDPWAYMAPGWPEKAAEFAYRDAYLTHRRNGVYGAMYFSAAESAAFCVDDPMEALKIGLTEIPSECELAKAIRWSLDEYKNIHTYEEARKVVDERYPGYNIAHTLNNACLTVFAIGIGGTDYSKVISQSVAMGLDNDCTTATAGSIVGAVVGIKQIPEHWYAPFNDTVRSYLKGIEYLKISDVLARFKKQAEIISKGE